MKNSKSIHDARLGTYRDDVSTYGTEDVNDPRSILPPSPPIIFSRPLPAQSVYEEPNTTRRIVLKCGNLRLGGSISMHSHHPHPHPHPHPHVTITVLYCYADQLFCWLRLAAGVVHMVWPAQRRCLDVYGLWYLQRNRRACSLCRPGLLLPLYSGFAGRLIRM
jgi:hypothetical protein